MKETEYLNTEDVSASWCLHLLRFLKGVGKKSAFTARRVFLLFLIEPSFVPKVTNIEALPSYENNGREVCFSKAMVGRVSSPLPN